MNKIFQLRKTKRIVRNLYKLNLTVPDINQATFRVTSKEYLRQKIWNSLPPMKKVIKNFDIRKRITVSCKYRICQR